MDGPGTLRIALKVCAGSRRIRWDLMFAQCNSHPVCAYIFPLPNITVNVDRLSLIERLRVGVRMEAQHTFVLSRLQHSDGVCRVPTCGRALSSRGGLAGQPPRMRMEVRRTFTHRNASKVAKASAVHTRARPSGLLLSRRQHQLWHSGTNSLFS